MFPGTPGRESELEAERLYPYSSDVSESGSETGAPPVRTRGPEGRGSDGVRTDSEGL